MLNTMIMKSVRRMSTPEETIPQDEPDSEDEAIVILQTLIRGRAVQSLVGQNPSPLCIYVRTYSLTSY